MADNCEERIDNFKPVFKYYKNNNYLKSEKNNQIIDFLNIDNQCNSFKELSFNIKSIESPIKSDFHESNQWKVFAIEEVKGLLVIPQILKRESSEKWFNYLLKELPFSESQNLRANIALPPNKGIEDSNLRWISFGYHYDWNSKLYNDSLRNVMPRLLQQFTEYVSRSLGFDEFRGEAGLINYYRNDSTLCPHSDHSEPNRTAPLFSLSLGSTAIFLIGGTSKSSSKPIIPIYLRDCDLMIMTSECRQAFHAIPKILDDRNQNEIIKRINVNIRQVY